MSVQKCIILVILFVKSGNTCTTVARLPKSGAEICIFDFNNQVSKSDALKSCADQGYSGLLEIRSTEDLHSIDANLKSIKEKTEIQNWSNFLK
jgi:hypothetical protein